MRYYPDQTLGILVENRWRFDEKTQDFAEKPGYFIEKLVNLIVCSGDNLWRNVANKETTDIHVYTVADPASPSVLCV